MSAMRDAIRTAVLKRREELVTSDTQVRPFVETTTVLPNGEEITEYQPGAPMDAFVDVETGAESVRNGRLESEQAIMVEFDYDVAQDRQIDATSRLALGDQVLYVHATRDLHQVGLILECTCTARGTVDEEGGGS